MEYIKIYFANDDTQVSPEGEFDNAIEFVLRADLEETDSVRLYAEAEKKEVDGEMREYKSTETYVEPQGDNASNWALAEDDDGSEGLYEDWGEPLTLGTVGHGEENRVYFWVKAKALDTEEPQNDDSVTLYCEGIIGVV